MNSSEDPSYTVQSVKTAFGIINALQAKGEAGITEIAEYCDVSKSTVSFHIRTLRDEGYVVQDDAKYKLSLQFLAIGKRLQTQNRLYEYGKTPVDKLADETGEMVHLAVKQGKYTTYVYRSAGERAETDGLEPEFLWGSLDQHQVPHASATGKSILAELPTAERDEIIDDIEFKPLTEHTITDREELEAEIEQIEQNQYSLNVEEEIRGFNAIGAPISDGTLFGAVSLSGPSRRLDEETLREEVSDPVVECANVIELWLNSSKQGG